MVALDVKVKIDIATPIGKLGLGIPLILQENATKEIEYTECKSLDAIKELGFADTSKVYKAARYMFRQDDPPAKIAVVATTGTTKSWLDVQDNMIKGWRQLIVVTESETAVNVQEIMTVIEDTSNKMYFADVPLNDETTYNTKDIARTVLVYADPTADCPSMAAVIVGATAGKPAGSINYKNTILTGIYAQTHSDTLVEAIHAKGGLTIVEKAGDVVTSAGKTAGGDYIDIQDSIDYIISNIEYKTQKTLNLMDKVTYDNRGIAILESVCVSVMRDAYNNNIIAQGDDGTPMYSVNYLKREETEAADRAARHYKGGRFSFTVAGAIDFAEVTGTLEF